MPPKITSVHRSETLDKGKEFTLKCEAEGSPPPSVKWTRNGQRDPRQKVCFSDHQHASCNNHACTWVVRIVFLNKMA